MLCVIPMAGRGRRLRSITGNNPKALINIGGRLLIQILVECVAPVVTKICLVVGPESNAIQKRLGNKIEGIPVRYVTQPRPLGVADAVLRACPVVNGPFIIVMGDTYFDESLLPHIEMWKKSDSKGAILTEPVANRLSGNMGLVNVEDGRIVEIRKGLPRDKDECRVCGMMILPEEICETCRAIHPADTGEYELEDAVACLLDRGYKFIGIPFEGWRRNINKPEDLKEVELRYFPKNT